MARKAFAIKVELDLQAVTCPGVWLCSNGQVSVQMYMLDSCVQTSSCRPVFPIEFHEQFVFKKTLPVKYAICNLPKQLSKEWLYMELIQWDSCNSGNVLAYFQIPLSEILYPTALGGVATDAEVDLLMEPTPSFPGTLAPKVEVCTKTTLEETICSCGDNADPSSMNVSPKLIVCSGRAAIYNKGLCYSMKQLKFKGNKCAKTCRYYHTCGRPPFRYKKVDDGFLARRRVMDLPTQVSREMPALDFKGVELRKVLRESIKKQSQNKCSLDDKLDCACNKRERDPCKECKKHSAAFNEMNPQSRQVLFSMMPDNNPFEQIARRSVLNDNTYKCHNREGNDHGSSPESHPYLASTAYERSYPSKNFSIARRLHEKISKSLHNDDMNPVREDVWL